MNIKNSIINFLKKTTNSALEYKFPSFFAFLFAISSIILVFQDFNNIYLVNIALASILGFFYTLVAYFSKRRNILIAIFILLIGLYF